MWLLVGLGNPGPEYEDTRHNVGFQVIDKIAERARAGAPREKLGASVVEVRLGAERVLLCKPMEFMNLSGQAVRRVAQFWKVDASSTVVVHDDLDLPLGRLKLGVGGGPGGHNGVRSVLTDWGRADFARVRCGIGRPPGGGPAGTGHVLGTFAKDEREPWAAILLRAAEATETIVQEGLVTAMNRFNVRAGPRPAKGTDT